MKYLHPKRQTIAPASGRRTSRKKSAKTGAGFTLIELLIVISVVAILATLITVSSQRMIDGANSSRCVANLRAIGAANIDYAAENNGKIAARNNVRDEEGNPTPRTQWYRYIWRTYFGAANGDGTWQGDVGFCKQMVCPADPTRGGEPGVGESLRRSYNVNQALSTKGGEKRMQTVSKPSATMYAGDIDWRAAGDSEYIIGSNTKSLGAIPRSRHGGLANFVFLDGHVEPIVIDDIYPGEPRSDIFLVTQ